RSGCVHQSPTTSTRSISAPSNLPFSRASVEDARRPAAVLVPDPLHEVDRVVATVRDHRRTPAGGDLEEDDAKAV
uniref:Uncharacterized protein n=1 Tax=Oryza brachyantha TaxID=4533 RepID=J3NEU9_ORYBR